jgi:hypothetical protein
MIDAWEAPFTNLYSSGKSIHQVDADLRIMSERTSIVERHDKLVACAEASKVLRAAEAKRGLS